MTEEAPKIAICSCISKSPVADYTISLFKTVNYLKDKATVSWLHQVGHANLPRARNILVGKALAWGATDIIFIDDDIGWEPEAFASLMTAPPEVDILAGTPQRRTQPGEQISFCGGPDGTFKMELTDGRTIYQGWAATAFLRVKASVYERLKDKVEEFEYDGENFRAYYNYKIGLNPSGKTKGFIGEDYYFCGLAKENGIEVWVDPSIELRHHHTVALDEVLASHIQEK